MFAFTQFGYSDCACMLLCVFVNIHENVRVWKENETRKFKMHFKQHKSQVYGCFYEITIKLCQLIFRGKGDFVRTTAYSISKIEFCVEFKSRKRCTFCNQPQFDHLRFRSNFPYEIFWINQTQEVDGVSAFQFHTKYLNFKILRNWQSTLFVQRIWLCSHWIFGLIWRCKSEQKNKKKQLCFRL